MSEKTKTIINIQHTVEDTLTTIWDTTERGKWSNKTMGHTNIDTYITTPSHIHLQRCT